MRAPRTASLALTLLAAAVGCGGDEKPATQTLVVIDAEAGIRGAAETLEVRAGPVDAEPSYDERFTRDGEDLVWPRVLSLVPRDGDASRRFLVTARALDAGGDFLAQARLASGYLQGKQLVVTLLLEDACARIDCGADDTCREGECGSPDIDPEQLQDYDPEDIDAPMVVPMGEPPRDVDAGDGGEAGVQEEAGAPDTGPSDLGEGGMADTGPGVMDAGTDAGTGAGTDAGNDAGTDACTPTDEMCNGADDDCDGMMDEDPGPTPLCELVQAEASCNASACQIDDCNPGHQNCDDDPDTGCEVPTSDEDHCGACGNDCSALDRVEVVSCVDDGGFGCRIDSCETGFRSCDGDVGTGCETNIASDAANCGGCNGVDNEPCTGLDNVDVSSCQAGECVIEGCTGAYLDCNRDPADGCEHDGDTGPCCDAGMDGDNDGVNDCDDGCPLDTGSTAPTDCGCPSSPAAPGTPCTDDPCGVARQCDGDATCGDLSACRPEGTCTYWSYPGMSSVGYWACEDTLEWNQARTRCLDIAVGGWELVRIDDMEENDFVQQMLSGGSWLGAHDRDVEGQWRWTIGYEQFWQGQAGGSTVGGLYAHWASGEPSGDGIISPRDVAVMQGDGFWGDVNGGTNTRAFVCEGPVDECPFSYKVLPGVCGCDSDDVDTDGDGVLDCDDDCPNDATFTSVGPCGCPSTPAAPGSDCTNYCSTAATCDDAAFCGDASSCPPGGGTCTYRSYAGMAGHGYWICADTRNRGDAILACQSIGAHLVKIDDFEENEFVRENIQAESHTGGGDAEEEGVFRWPDRTVFYDGTALLYSNWAGGTPGGGGDCVVIDPVSGEWTDVNCASPSRPYVCEVP